LTEFNSEEKEVQSLDENSGNLKQINELLNQRVRPYLAGDGGGWVLGIEGYSYDATRACGSCPSSISAYINRN
jgi:Fe-S cluster biogenesis protein NfuA